MFLNSRLSEFAISEYIFGYFSNSNSEVASGSEYLHPKFLKKIMKKLDIFKDLIKYKWLLQSKQIKLNILKNIDNSTKKILIDIEKINIFGIDWILVNELDYEVIHENENAFLNTLLIFLFFIII